MSKIRSLRRALSLLMCVIFCIGAFPVDALALSMNEDGNAVYEIGDTVWVRGEEGEPEQQCAEGNFWIPEYDENDQPVTRQGLCDKAEHSHVYVCAEACPLLHSHGEGCYEQVYTGCLIHSHDESCTVEAVYNCGLEAHENHDSCTCEQMCSMEEHSHAQMACPGEIEFCCALAPHSHEQCQQDENGNYLCGMEEHSHSVEAGCAYETVFGCGKAEHSHADGNCTLVTVYSCGMELHTHDESCGASLVYPGCTEHVAHDENCASELKLVCGLDEHACITEGCAADCAMEEHVHGNECDMDVTYYRWVVVEDSSASYAETDKGLPIHFFIAAPGEQVKHDGTYTNYRTDLWYKNNRNNAAYATVEAGTLKELEQRDGIRNANNEADIIRYVADWGSSNAEEIRNFGSVTFNRETYSQTDYDLKWVTICLRGGDSGFGCYCGVNYKHIHIDAILTKKVLPAEMNLVKSITETLDTAENFKFTLQRYLLDANYNVINEIDTSFGTNGSLTLNANIPAGQTSGKIVSVDGTPINFGYYKLTEHIDSRWRINEIYAVKSNGQEQLLNSDELYIQIATDGTFKFNSTLNGVYTSASEIRIINERAPLRVSYRWEGIPEGLAVLPETAENITPGSNYTINSSYYPGIRVLGKAGVNDPSDNTDSGAYYYVFDGWKYYEEIDGKRKYLSYDENNNLNPSAIKEIERNAIVHGLWIREELPQAEGYITINKSFVGRADDPSISNYYMTVRHGNVETDISAAHDGTWNADRTQWSYNFPIRESGEYIIAEGKYDVAGYNVDKEVSISPVPGLSEAGAQWESPLFETDGHSYTEFGQVIKVTLPYDTSAVSGVSAQADGAFYTGSVNFTNTYTKRTGDEEHQLPDFIVRKFNGSFTRVLEGAEFVLTSTEPEATTYNISPGELGYTVEDLPAGSYTLVETKAPEGYVRDNTVYYVNVVEDGQPIEELRLDCDDDHAEHVNDCYVYVPVQKYKITVTDVAGLNVNDEASNAPAIFNETLFRLNIPNEQIKADMNIVKTFYDDGLEQSFVPTSGSIMVDIYGPVVYKDGELSDHGPLIHNDLIIDSTGDWALTVNGLPYGEYFVEETLVSLHGYEWTGTSFNGEEQIQLEDHYGTVVTVDSFNDIQLNVENRYKKWKAADFYLQKTDLAQNDLPGARFRLFDGSSNVTEQYLDKNVGRYDSQSQSAVTNNNGVLHFHGFTLAEGETSKNFTLKEIAAPNGYYLDDREYTVTVTQADGEYDITVDSGTWSADEDFLTVFNRPILGQITVNKHISGDLSEESIPSDAYVRFAIRNADGSVVRYATVTGEDEWSYTFADLPLGTYTVSEIYASVAGYSYTTSYSINGAAAVAGTSASVTLSDNSVGTLGSGIPTSASSTVSFTNNYDRQELLTVNKASFNVYKRDEKGNGLAGATFTLYADESCQTELSGVPFETEKITDEYGFASFTELKLPDLERYGDYEPGKGRQAEYYLKESSAPAGYVPADTVWKITLDEEIHVEKLNNRNVFETVVDWITGLFKKDEVPYEWVAVNSVAVVNERIKGTLNISKDYGAAKDDKENARVEVHVHGPILRGENDSITDIGPLVKVIELTGGATSASLPGLELGEYVLRETFASIHGYTWNGVDYMVGGIKEDTVTVGDEDFFVFEISGDSYSPTANVELRNTYTEWEAADFYIYKYRRNADNSTTGLGGAVFELCSEDGRQVIASQSTNISGYAYFGDLEVPAYDADKKVVYTLKEKSPPDNYYPVNTVWTVTVTHDGTGYDVDITPHNNAEGTQPRWIWVDTRDALWVENEEILGSITIEKTFDSDTVPDDLLEIKASLISSSGTSIPVILNADNNWSDTVDGLSMGRYYVIEQNANMPGYTLSTSYYVDNVLQGAEINPASYATVDLDEGENSTAPTATVTIENAYVKQTDPKITPASFSVKKVDAEEPSKTLDGAKFRLYKIEDGKIETIAEEETENGIAVFKDLQLPERDYDEYENGQTLTYYLTETDAPAGYDKDDTVWKLELSENIVQFDVLNEDRNVFEAIVNVIASLFIPNQSSESEPTYTEVEGNQLVVSNRRIKGDIGFVKSFSFVDSENQPWQIDNALKAALSIELHVHGPVKWTDENETEIADMGQTHTLTLPGSALNDKDTLIGYVSDLELGDYLIHETKVSVHGFNWENADVGIVVDNNSEPAKTVSRLVDGKEYTYYVVSLDETIATEEAEEVTVAINNHYKKWDSADFYVYKTDDNDEPLADAAFQLYSDEQCTQPVESEDFTASVVTGLDGMARFSGFTVEPGQKVSYYLQEYEAPEHFHKNENVWKVTISHGESGYDLEIKDLGDPGNKSVDTATDTITVVNQPVLAELTIHKRFEGDAIAEPKNLTLTVNVTGPDGKTQKVFLTTEAEEWTARLNNLPLGTYTVVEDTALAKVAGYDLLSTTYAMDGSTGVNTVSFTDSDYTAELVITNTYDRREAVINNPDEFTIIKTDDAGTRLPGAEFTLTNNHNPSDVRYFTTGADGTVLIDRLIGNGTVSNQSSRSYTLEETKAPEGHELGENRIWKIDVAEEDGQIVVMLNGQNNTYETIWDWIIGAITPGDEELETLTVVNPRKTAEISVTKTVSYEGLSDAANDDMVKSLNGSRYSFELYVDQQKAETITVSAGETKTFNTKLPYGSSYEVRELVSASDSFISEHSANASGTVGDSELDGINVDFENIYKFVSSDELVINFIKVSSGSAKTPLSGAKFTLYDSSDTAIGYFTSDKNGYFSISQIQDAGNYILKETAAPEGYYRLHRSIAIEASWEYKVIEDADGNPVILRTLLAKLSGRRVNEIGTNYYSISNVPLSSAPPTGDNSNILLHSFMALASLMGIVGATLLSKAYPKKKGKHER